MPTVIDCFFFSQGVLLNVLVYYNIINIFRADDLGKDTNLASMLQVSL